MRQQRPGPPGQDPGPVTQACGFQSDFSPVVLDLRVGELDAADIASFVNTSFSGADSTPGLTGLPSLQYRPQLLPTRDPLLRQRYEALYTYTKLARAATSDSRKT